MNTNLITDLTNGLGISTISLQSLIAISFTFYASPEENRMRNSLVVAGIGALFYVNDQQNKAKNNVLNYFIQ